MAEGIQGLVEQNFGERFYGIYVDDYKLGFIAYKLSQNKNDVIADFSMTVRIPASLARKKLKVLNTLFLKLSLVTFSIKKLDY